MCLCLKKFFFLEGYVWKRKKLAREMQSHTYLVLNPYANKITTIKKIINACFFLF